jgi:hypothetical protein
VFRTPERTCRDVTEKNIAGASSKARVSARATVVGLSDMSDTLIGSSVLLFCCCGSRAMVEHVQTGDDGDQPVVFCARYNRLGPAMLVVKIRVVRHLRVWPTRQGLTCPGISLQRGTCYWSLKVNLESLARGGVMISCLIATSTVVLQFGNVCVPCTTGMAHKADGQALRRRPNVAAVGVAPSPSSEPARPSA